MLQRLNPASVAAPFSRYSHAVIAPQGYRWLYISGQVGCDRDRKIADGFEAQAERAFHNLIACIRESGFDVQDLVKVTVLLTRGSDIAAYREIRDRMLGSVEPASTLMIVAGLAAPELLIEVEGVAARAAENT
ncbi:RidA family protein [Dongia deserti]|uniref:RidA family protein n=1 Tax=Dongia deserti TaxID=2268030 RepID=UPI000E64D4C2|nr:RidA family protein [Dongia deserti]